MFDKLKFWKKDELDFPKLEPLPGDALPTSDSLGLGADRTAGLGGTGAFEPMPALQPFQSSAGDSDVIRGKQDYLRELPSSQPRAQTGMASADMLEKDMEIISSKLDAIKAMVESVNQRLEQMERQGRDAYKRW